MAACDHDVHGRLAEFVGKREAVSGGPPARARSRLPAVDDVPDHALLYQRYGASRHTLTVKGRAGLQRVRDIIVNCDVLAENLFTNAARQKAALIAQRGGAEV